MRQAGRLSAQAAAVGDRAFRSERQARPSAVSALKRFMTRELGRDRSGWSPAFAGPAQLAQMLGFKEFHQLADLGREMVMQVEDLGRLTERHPGEKDELVGRPQGGAGLGAQAIFYQSPAVDAANARRVARDSHVAGNVLRDLRLAVDIAAAADRRELVNAHFLGDISVGFDVHMAADHRKRADRDPIRQLAIVGDVRAAMQADCGCRSG